MGLKEFRLERNMTQEELARCCGISLRTYQNIEKTNNTNLLNARNISIILDGTIEEIFFDEEYWIRKG